MTAEIIPLFNMGRYSYCAKDDGESLLLLRCNKKSGAIHSFGGILDIVFLRNVEDIALEHYSTKEIKIDENGISNEYVRMYVYSRVYINGKRLNIFNFCDWGLPFNLKNGDKYYETHQSIVEDEIIKKISPNIIRVLKSFIEEQINAYENAGMEF